ncbi:MAG: hypothetical protein HOC18_06795 [Candidatus Marinimicrobia bacterium]|jgi:hypothetical protein|nr:hypothetical protein [Candidatus Neomarinimicrobiota bacterium]
MEWKTLFMGAGITALILYIFDEELQPVVDKSKSFLVGLIGKNAETFNAGANGTDGVNNRGDVVLGTNRVYQIPINSGGTSIPVITPLAEPVSGSGNYVGQTAYPMAAQNNLSELIDGASWMNAAAYTNASFGQNYSGNTLGNE